MKYLWFVAFLATIVAANWAITTYGAVPVGFGLLAPAGVYFAGLGFTFRDLIHESAGSRWVWLAIVTGTVLSSFVSPQFAIASGAAFALSETVDYLVYAPLRRRSWLAAVGLSNTVGLLVDSALFLWLAFGSLDYLAGQVVGKAWMTVAAVIVIGFLRAHYLPVRVSPSGPAA